MTLHQARRNRRPRNGRLVLAAATALLALGAGSAYGAGGRGAASHAHWLSARGVVDREVGVDTLVPPDACPIGGTVTDTSALSCSQTDTTVEPTVAGDPADPSHLVIAYQEGRRFSGGATGLGYAVTFDAGRTWQSGQLGFTKSAGGPSAAISDPWVAFGLHGDVYVSGSPMDDTAPPCPSPCGAGIVVSHDGGKTWSQPVVAEKGECFDRTMVTVDTGSGAGHHPGRVYLACNAGSRLLIFVMYSDDGGQTWVTTQTAYGSPGLAGLSTWPVGLQVMPNGDLWVLNEDGDSLMGPHDKMPVSVNFMTMLVYPGAGATATGQQLIAAPALPVANNSGYLVRQVRDDSAASMALSPRTGLVHVCWADAAGHVTERVNGVVCTSSSDALTWSTPVHADSGSSNPWTNRWNAAVSVAPNGRMLVAWRQREEAATEAADGSSFSPHVDTYVAESRDDGATFGAPRKVNLVSSDMGFAAMSLGFGAAGLGSTASAAVNTVDGPLAFLGDFLGVVATDHAAYVVRAEAVRTSASEQATFPARYHHQRVWVATVR